MAIKFDLQIASLVARILLRSGWLTHGGNIVSIVAKLLAGDFRQILEEYQKHFGLTPTGEPDPGTVAHILLPRFCGRPDREALESEDASIPPIPSKEVIWHVTNPDSFPGLTAQKVLECFDTCWQHLASVCGIKVRNASDVNEANAIITAGFIDGGSGTLAWSELANRQAGQRLRQQYDNGEQWQVRPGLLAATNQIDLWRVILHESIHLLGFSHDSSQPCLMNPTYSLTIDKPNAYDVSRLVRAYGPSVSTGGPIDPPAPGKWMVQAEVSSDGTIKIPGVKIAKVQ